MKYKTHCQACGTDYDGDVYTPRCKACNAPKVSEYITGYGVTLIEYANVATCEHSPLYRIENESAGGAGCPICNAERQARRTERPPFVPGCSLGVCSDCIPYDGCIPVAGDERVSSYEESRDAAF